MLMAYLADHGLSVRGSEFGRFESASPWEPVIFNFPSRAASWCGLGPRLSEMNLR